MTKEKSITQQALEDCIRKKADLVARSLGKNCVYNKDDMKVLVERNEEYKDENKTKIKHVLLETKVFYTGKLVFHERNLEILCYEPGEWNDKLENLYEKAKANSN